MVCASLIIEQRVSDHNDRVGTVLLWRVLGDRSGIAMADFSRVPDADHVLVYKHLWRNEKILVSNLDDTMVYLGSLDWEMDFDNGAGFLFKQSLDEMSDHDMDVRLVEDVLGHSLWHREGVNFRDECWIRTADGKHSMAGRNYATRKTRSVRVPMSPHGEKLEIDIAVFDKPRCSMHVMWSMPGIFIACNWSQYHGRARSWASHSAMGMCRHLDKHGLDPSFHYLAQIPWAPGGEAPDRTLRFQSMSTAAVMTMLAVWARFNRREGGFLDAGDREKAWNFLKALLNLLHVVQWRLVFAEEPNHDHYKSHGAITGDGEIVFLGVRDGEVHLEGLIIGAAGDKPIFAEWLEIVQEKEETRVEVCEFLQRIINSCHSDVAFDMFKMFMWTAARELDDVVRGASVPGIIDLDPPTEEQEEAQMHENQAAYMKAARRVTAKAFEYIPMLSLCCDDSNVRGKILCATAIVLHTNEAFFPPVQVHIQHLFFGFLEIHTNSHQGCGPRAGFERSRKTRPSLSQIEPVSQVEPVAH